MVIHVALPSLGRSLEGLDEFEGVRSCRGTRTSQQVVPQQADLTCTWQQSCLPVVAPIEGVGKLPNSNPIANAGATKIRVICVMEVIYRFPLLGTTG
jgi:hypothetical protein